MQTTEKLRSIIITGANRGIGYVTIEKLLEEKTSYDIILTARDSQKGQEALTSLLKKHKSSQSKLTFQELDVCDSKSIDSFVSWVKNKHNGNIDVVVNNAGVNIEKTIQDRLNVININLTGAIELTEKLLPYLSSDGKIIMISSQNGQLSWQGHKIREMLDDSTMTREKFDKITNELIDKTKKGDHSNLGWSSDTYDNTKVLLNAYTRWILTTMIKGDQQCYTVDPGWCRTEMGGSYAPLPVERGADTPVYLIKLPFKFNEKYNGKFFRDCKLHPF